MARELGHQSDEMVRRVYAHLGSTRHRSDVVEYRVAQHLDKLADRLRKLGFVTGNVTGGVAMLETESPASTEVQAGNDVPEWARRDSNARPLAPERRPPRRGPPNGAGGVCHKEWHSRTVATVRCATHCSGLALTGIPWSLARCATASQPPWSGWLDQIGLSLDQRASVAVHGAPWPAS